MIFREELGLGIKSSGVGDRQLGKLGELVIY